MTVAASHMTHAHTINNHPALPPPINKVAAKEYYSNVFLKATGEGLTEMIDRGDLCGLTPPPPDPAKPHDVTNTHHVLLSTAESPASAHKAAQGPAETARRRSKRVLVPRDSSNNQRVLRELAAQNALH